MMMMMMMMMMMINVHCVSRWVTDDKPFHCLVSNLHLILVASKKLWQTSLMPQYRLVDSKLYVPLNMFSRYFLACTSVP
jgi:hypothetical protein